MGISSERSATTMRTKNNNLHQSFNRFRMELRVSIKRCGWAAMVLFPLLTSGQVTITGPSCVLAGTTYQYLVSGSWDAASTMQVCLTGGAIVDSGKACRSNGTPVASLGVVWTPGASTNLQISTSKGNATFQVTITTPLAGGMIDSAIKAQSLPSPAIPKVISCSPAAGGSCSPNYQYQWQQSIDLLDWTDIPQATGPGLVLSQALAKTSYYRRRVTEVSSGTIAYSDAAYVEVAPVPPVSIAIPTQN